MHRRRPPRPRKPGTDTVTLAIQYKDPISGKFITVLTGAGAELRIVITHSAGSNFTYSVAAWPLP